MKLYNFFMSRLVGDLNSRRDLRLYMEFRCREIGNNLLVYTRPTDFPFKLIFFENRMNKKQNKIFMQTFLLRKRLKS